MIQSGSVEYSGEELHSLEPLVLSLIITGNSLFCGWLEVKDNYNVKYDVVVEITDIWSYGRYL